jgi:hypothetical protein
MQNYKKKLNVENQNKKDFLFFDKIALFSKYCTRVLAYIKKMLYLCGLFTQN